MEMLQVRLVQSQASVKLQYHAPVQSMDMVHSLLRAWMRWS